MFSAVFVICLMGFWEAEGLVSNYAMKNTEVVTGTCPITDFENLDGICYYLSKGPNGKFTWDDANVICKKMGDNLDYTVGLAELNFQETWRSDGLILQKIAETGHSYWLGATDKNTEGEWKWETSGRTLSLQNSYWKQGDPDTGELQDCLIGVVENQPDPNKGTSRTYLGDDPCNSNTRFYVCQIF